MWVMVYVKKMRTKVIIIQRLKKTLFCRGQIEVRVLFNANLAKKHKIFFLLRPAPGIVLEIVLKIVLADNKKRKLGLIQ
jgi:hypothetical protein